MIHTYNSNDVSSISKKYFDTCIYIVVLFDHFYLISVMNSLLSLSYPFFYFPSLFNENQGTVLCIEVSTNLKPSQQEMAHGMKILAFHSVFRSY
jgi:hypothetical protein